MGFGFKKRSDEQNEQPADEQVANSNNSVTADHAEKGSFDDNTIDTPLPLVTMHSFLLCILISMGGFIFGYDTGQISGFLEMNNFLNYFGQGPENHKHFSNVRSGLIVGLVRTSLPWNQFGSNTNQTLAINWYLLWCSRCCSHRR